MCPGAHGRGDFPVYLYPLNGVRSSSEMMDWGSGAEFCESSSVWGRLGVEWVDDDDEVFVVLAPQSVVQGIHRAPVAGSQSCQW